MMEPRGYPLNVFLVCGVIGFGLILAAAFVSHLVTILQG